MTQMKPQEELRRVATPRTDAAWKEEWRIYGESGCRSSPAQGMLQFAEELERELAAAEKRIGAMELDAGRYRWLRENAEHGSDEPFYLCVQGLWMPADHAEANLVIDAAIDSAKGAKT